MKYGGQAIGSTFYPKLLGIYECELQSVVNESITAGYDQIVDVGAAEGYYAVGLAVRCPHAFVTAFEMLDEGRKLLRETACLNGVESRLDVRGCCTPEELSQALARHEGRRLLICDCEGYEQELLDLDRVPALRHTSILVELHEFIFRGISQRIRTRFEATHAIEEIWQREREVKEFPYSTVYTRLMPQKYPLRVLNELRPERMNWFWMKPKTEKSPDGSGQAGGKGCGAV